MTFDYWYDQIEFTQFAKLIFWQRNILHVLTRVCS